MYGIQLNRVACQRDLDPSEASRGSLTGTNKRGTTFHSGERTLPTIIRGPEPCGEGPTQNDGLKDQAADPWLPNPAWSPGMRPTALRLNQRSLFFFSPKKEKKRKENKSLFIMPDSGVM